MKRLTLTLSVKSKAELKQALHHHPKAYVRERASALLQIASGKSGLWVAQNGLLRKRRKHTVYDWVKAYQSKGMEGLLIQAGRGRKPAFFPPK